MIPRGAVLLVLLAGCDAVFGIAAVPDALPDRALVAQWRMDGIANNTLVDDSGNHHDGHCTPAACPSPIAGVIDAALQFDGAASLIQIGDGMTLATPRSFTVSAWLDIPGLPLAYACPLNKIYGPGNSNSWQLCVASDGELVVFWESGTGPQSLVSTPEFLLPVGVWTHVAIRYDHISSKLSLILDGATTNVVSTTPPLFDAGSISLGADLDSGGTSAPFAGGTDDLRIYSFALSVEELTMVRAGLSI